MSDFLTQYFLIKEIERNVNAVCPNSATIITKVVNMEPRICPKCKNPYWNVPRKN